MVKSLDRGERITVNHLIIEIIAKRVPQTPESRQPEALRMPLHPLPMMGGEGSLRGLRQGSADFAEQVWPPKDVTAIDLEKLRPCLQLLACRPRIADSAPANDRQGCSGPQKSDDGGRASPKRGAAQAASLICARERGMIERRVRSDYAGETKFFASASDFGECFLREIGCNLEEQGFRRG